MKTEVTIGIPVYKSVNYIEQTLLSALSQTFLSIEFLVIDDCGNDGSVDLIRSLQLNHPRGSEIRLIHNDINRGVSYCRNRIIDEAKGTFLYFLDSDDVIEPDAIHVLYQSLVAKNAQISYGSYEIIDNSRNVIHKYQKPSLFLEGDYKLATFAFKNINIFHVSVCNFLINLSFLKETGIRFIDTSYWEDMAFSTELAIRVKRAVMVPIVTYHYIHHPDSLSHFMKHEKCLRDEIDNNINVLNYLKKKTLTTKECDYVPFLFYNLGLNSFYMVCNILKKKRLINPPICLREIGAILNVPYSLCDILHFKERKMSNVVFWLLNVLPVSFSLLVIKMFITVRKLI